MATVNGITAEKAQEIEDASVVSGHINNANGHLILVTHGGTEIDAGLVSDLVTLAAISSDVSDLDSRVTTIETQPKNICRVYFTADSGIANGVEFTIGWNANGIITDPSMHSTSTNNTRITIPNGGNGYYQLDAAVTFAVNAGGSRRGGRWKKNGSSFSNLRLESPLSGGSHEKSVLYPSLIVPLVAGDYIELSAYQDSGSSVNIMNGQFTSWMQVSWLRPL